MKLSVIIVNYNVKYFLEVCLHSVTRALQGMPSEIIVVDNNSKDDSVEMVRKKFPEVKLIENKENTGFSKANNQGVAIAQGEYILFLNPDTVVPEDCLKQLTNYLDTHPDAASVGPRIIDGKGQYAPDSKKSFPSLSVAIFKTTGINKIFSKSAYFNKYYAVHVGENEEAPVDVLSGCCMMVRHNLIKEMGCAFDEDYFMYCEDVDLSYRLQQAGYKNMYYPKATIIHYKGESTRKATLSYVKIFNEALSTFVKKHYKSSSAKLFILFINVGLVLRAILSGIKMVLKILTMPLIDGLILLGTLWFLKEFWVEHVKNIMPIPLSSVIATFPIYIGLWLICLYLNGAYDQPYRPLRVIRGMVIGTIVILAYYGLLQPGLRYSRAIIVFSGFTGTVIMLGIHELLHRLGILKYVPYDKLPRKAVVVASEDAYAATASTLQRVHYAPELSGRISPAENKGNALAHVGEMKELLYTAGVNEVIFCVNGLTYQEIFRQMQHCGDKYDYKIHLPGSESFVGSNSSHTSGDLYTLDTRFNLSDFGSIRNKRVIDIAMSVLLLILWPLLLWFVKQPFGFLRNIFSVAAGKHTWVGYAVTGKRFVHLPALKKGILPPYFVLNNYTPEEKVKQQLNIAYAKHYTPGTDILLILKNFKYLGQKQKNILQK